MRGVIGLRGGDVVGGCLRLGTKYGGTLPGFSRVGGVGDGCVVRVGLGVGCGCARAVVISVARIMSNMVVHTFCVRACTALDVQSYLQT